MQQVQIFDEDYHPVPSSISHEIAFQDWINHFQAGGDGKSFFDLNFHNFKISCSSSLSLWYAKKANFASKDTISKELILK